MLKVLKETPLGFGLSVAVSNSEGRIESQKAFTEKASRPRRQGAYRHQTLCASRCRGQDYEGRGLW